MKEMILIIGIIIIFMACKSTETNKKAETLEQGSVQSKAKLSPMTALLIDEIKKVQKDFNDLNIFIPSEEMINKYGIKHKDSKYYVNTMVKVSNDFSDEYLKENDFFIRTKAGNIYTLSITLEQLIKLSEHESVLYIQIDEKIRFKK